MVIPEGMLVLAAAETVKTLDEHVRQDQRHELLSESATVERVYLLKSLSPAFVQGYEFGLQVARCWLATNPAATPAILEF
jgi:hypothetical protein